MARTLVLIKPDGVERRLVGEILARFERRGLTLVALELRSLDRSTAAAHYGEHEGKPFYEPLVEFITRGPLVAAVIEGPDNVWEIVRHMMGTTDASQAAPGTIRGDFATIMRENLVHGSDSEASAAREIALFFPHLA